LPSSDPTKAVPLATAGDDVTAPPVGVAQCTPRPGTLPTFNVFSEVFSPG
jgi:hypothetical protein